MKLWLMVKAIFASCDKAIHSENSGNLSFKIFIDVKLDSCHRKLMKIHNPILLCSLTMWYNWDIYFLFLSPVWKSYAAVGSISCVWTLEVESCLRICSYFPWWFSSNTLKSLTLSSWKRKIFEFFNIIY